MLENVDKSGLGMLAARVPEAGQEKPVPGCLPGNLIDYVDRVRIPAASSYEDLAAIVSDMREIARARGIFIVLAQGNPALPGNPNVPGRAKFEMQVLKSREAPDQQLVYCPEEEPLASFVNQALLDEILNEEPDDILFGLTDEDLIC